MGDRIDLRAHVFYIGAIHGLGRGMRIGVDARKIGDTGIGRYIENLVRNLLDIDRRNEYVLFMVPGDMGRYDFISGRAEQMAEASGKYSVTEHFSLPRKAAARGVELFHAPHYVLPRFMACRSVVTVHDIIHLLDRSFGLFARTYASMMIRSATAKADAVLTVSGHTRDNLVEKLGVPREKIVVAPNGGGSDFSRPPEDEIGHQLGKLRVSPGYFLFVGSDRPHKNLGAVEAALSRMGPDTRFVIVGRVGGKARARFDRFAGRAVFLDGLEKREMAALYSGATALLFPSYHEGFGLPPLEAMACGTPVVASNRSSIPEVVCDAAVPVDPDDSASIAAALGKIRDDAKFRDELAAKGYARVKAFSWEKTARMTLDCYERVMA